MSESAQGRLGRRLRRILMMVPYAIRHPGVSVEELSRRFEVPKDSLIEDLHLLFLCGLPGYGPGDLIDVSMEEDRVYVRMADYFAAPLTLTPAEALELHAQGSALAELPEMEEAESLRRALAKLERALGTAGRGDGEALIEVRLEPGAGEHVRAIREAVARRRRVELEYLSAARGEMTTRKVDPWALFVT
ncbi:MAG: WYL domain-containing protein, partial [Actinomycetota bacterium]